MVEDNVRNNSLSMPECYERDINGKMRGKIGIGYCVYYFEIGKCEGVCDYARRMNRKFKVEPANKKKAHA